VSLKPRLFFGLGIVASLGCSSSGTGGAAIDAGAPMDANGADAPSGADAFEANVADVARAVDAPSSGVNVCASCTAQRCGPELLACANSQPCTNGLVAFNDCFGQSPDGGASCGATFASSDAAAMAIWTCMASSCKVECGA
jgi:hypothetical protein